MGGSLHIRHACPRALVFVVLTSRHPVCIPFADGRVANDMDAQKQLERSGGDGVARVTNLGYTRTLWRDRRRGRRTNKRAQRASRTILGELRDPLG